jgi:hypothetical protein
MRIRTVLTPEEIFAAAEEIGVGFARFDESDGYDVALSGSGPGASKHRILAVPMATFDETGMFHARLFDRDPNAATDWYRTGALFHWLTVDRYRTLTPAGQHPEHKWEYGGISDGRTYTLHLCQCGAALRRWLP